MSLPEAFSLLSDDFHHDKLEKYSGEKVPNSYIFIFATSDDRDATLLDLSETVNEIQKFDICLDPTDIQYCASATLAPDKLLKKLDDDNVKKVYENGMCHTWSHVQNAPWGISRLSLPQTPKGHRALKSNFPYHHAKVGKNEVNVFLVDTGIDGKHSEFEGRVTESYIYNPSTKKLEKTAKAEDPHGHGTHCAATIGGRRYGIARNCKLISIQVFDRNGRIALNILCQALRKLLDLIRDNYWNDRNVMNLSFGANAYKPMDDAVQSLINARVHVVAAAGNTNNDAMHHSPARMPSVITVGASTFTDSRAWFSNKGPLVDIYAPGVFICSATNDTTNTGQSTDTEILTGTSMSCAHVSGLVAHLLSIQEKPTNPEEMRKLVIETSFRDRLSDIPCGSYNRLARLPSQNLDF